MDTIKGTLYEQSGRWHWKVRLPGSDKRKSYALARLNEKATKDPKLAREIAKRIWEKALAGLNGTPEIETIQELIEAYYRYVVDYYPESSDMPNRIKYALVLLEDQANDEVHTFGPLKLRQCREQMLNKDLSVKIVNERTQFIRKMFKWAAGREIVRGEQVYALEQVENLTGRERGVKPTQERLPVAIDVVRQTLSALSIIVQDMVKIQLYGAMRPSEMLRMRPCDLDTSGEFWVYRVPQERSKNQARTKKFIKEIPLNSKVQDVLLTYLVTAGREDTFFRYSSASYRRAITRACDKLKIEHWTPYQLRHTASTYIRHQLGDDGLSASQAMLGQKHADTAEIYARLNKTTAVKASKELEKIEL